MASLKRIVGVTFGIATVVGSSVGIGILKWPGTIASYTTNEILYIFFWIAGGLLSLVGCYIYSELGTRIPIAGGPFVFGREAFGKAGGFLTGWMDIIMNTSSIAYLGIAVIEYVNSLFGLNLHLGVTTSLMIILIAWIQWQGLKGSSRIQIIMSLAKCICLLVFVIACFMFTAEPVSANESVITEPVPLFTAIILSLRAVFLAYTGWNSAVYFTEEDVNPGKNLPKSMAYGVITIIVIYALVNLGIMSVLSLSQVAGTDMAAANVAGIIFGSYGATVVTAIGTVSILGVLYATMLFTPRIVFALSKAGLAPLQLQSLNKKAIPGVALIIITGISVLFASTGLFFFVASIAALFGILIDLFVYIAYIVICKRKRETGFRAKAYPLNAILMICITAGLIAGLFIEDTENAVYGLILLIAGLLVYYIFYGRKKPLKERLSYHVRDSNP